MAETKPTTLSTGSPVASDEHSLSVGPDGPIVLHDVYLVEKLAQFNRERVPERIVHAKGGGAYGDFEVTGDVTAYTKACLFQPGTKTPMVARYSTVAGEMGSPDTWRDVRGFALKFYTTEGNFDIVGNNTPVFFIKDGMKFPDFIHSQKRLPGSNLRDLDMQWDFWTLSPETAHQVTYLMGDRGLPADWRHMNGYSSHTYSWTNKDGERFWVKYHFVSEQGTANMTAEQADTMAGSDADHHIRDLYEAIERGEFPSWKVMVQIMPYEDAKTYRFNPFDLTKVWSFKDYPRIEVGRYTLNRNPENYFAEIEQLAFAPSNLVAGAGISPDKMLLARMFSYADAHRYRIGSNFAELPVNAPKNAEVNNYQRAGHLRHTIHPHTAPVYAPNSFGGPVADPAQAGDERGWESDGEMIRAAATLHSEDDDWGQARSMIRDVFTDEQRDRFVETLAGQYKGLTADQVKERFFWYWTQVDPDIADRVKAAVGV
ncbi:MAG: catalase [Propionibacteriaceae bacterium]|jgi:catalase|nr:catalase [Propionibacteriaceae bacterium]